MTHTPRFGLPYIASGQAQKEITHNIALNALDGLVMLRVLDRDLTTPPGSPANGDAYIVAAAATGDWAGHDAHIALWHDGWRFYAPQNGWGAFVDDEEVWATYYNNAWCGPSLGAVARVPSDSAARPTLQIGNTPNNSLFVGDGSATFTNGTAYIGFNAVRTASNTWTFTGDGSRNGGAAIDGRMDGAIRMHIRASLSGSTVTETDSNMATNERMQVQRTLISMGGPLGSESFRVATTASMVNRVEVVGSATGNPIVVRAAGTDSNIDVQLTPKGTGVFNLSLDSGNLASTVGSAGAASALPATPSGYLRVRLNGTIRKIPYYND